jgi:hypothetical protein
VLATALSIHLLKTGEGLLHACISSSYIHNDRPFFTVSTYNSVQIMNVNEYIYST